MPPVELTPLPSLAGGALVGAGLALLLVASGRPLGASGALGGLLAPGSDRRGVRALFLAGLLAGGLLLALLAPARLAFGVDRSLGALAAAGLLVGVGTRLGNGCTSGHGVCGVARLSPRSLAATAVFMAAGAVTVYVVEHLLGGRL